MRFIVCASSGTGSKRAKRSVRTADQAIFPDVEKAVWMWHFERRRRGFPVSGDMLLLKAQRAYAILHPRNKQWVPSRGWLDGFKKRFDIRGLSIAGESRSADVPAARKYVSAFRRLVLADVGE